MTVLWRASASTRKIFKAVNIGSHEKTLKTLIKNNTAGGPNDFSVILIKVEPPDIGTMMYDPKKYRLDRVWIYRFFLGGFIALIKVDQQPFSGNFQAISLNPNQPLHILLQDVKDLKEFQASSKIIHERYFKRR